MPEVITKKQASGRQTDLHYHINVNSLIFSSSWHIFVDVKIS